MKYLLILLFAIITINANATTKYELYATPFGLKQVVNSTVKFDFTINNDNWRITIDTEGDHLILAKQRQDGVYEWILNPNYDYNPQNLTPTQYFEDFIADVNQRLFDEYDNTVPPIPSDMEGALEWLIKHKTQFNESTNEVEVVY
jgi:hypothetical protein